MARTDRSIRGRYVQTTFGVDRETFARLVEYARERDVPVSQVGRVAIRFFLDHNTDNGGTENGDIHEKRAA